jgi:hypothetical protein
MGSNTRAVAYGSSVSDEEFTVDSTTPETLTVPTRARSALITVSGSSVRYRMQGTVTSSSGHLIADGGNIEVFRDDLSRIEFVASSGSADVFVTYFRE